MDRNSAGSDKKVQRQIYTELFPQKPTKADKRRLEILDGAIKAFATVSYEHVSFDDVAGPAKTSRRLVKHYFPDKDALFETTMKLIRGQYQAFVISAFTASSDPEVQFSEYVRSAVAWAHSQPGPMRAWILYFLVSSQQKKFRALHQELADMGAERIKSLITAMAPSARDMALPAAELDFAAKTIQRIITGAAIEICSERLVADHERIANDAVRAARIVAQAIQSR